MGAAPVGQTALQDALQERIGAALGDPDQAGNALRPLLAEALEALQRQNRRLVRLLRIADGYQRLDRDQTLTLAEHCDRQIRRMEKLARISDHYQRNLLEVTENLRQAANQDALTGLSNRRFLMTRLREESQRAARTGHDLALAMMDVDHFKRINDRFGHDAGDQALRAVADAIRREMRCYDIYGRWGGEEFLFLLPETDRDEAMTVLERLRARIQGIRVGGESAPAALSASFGLTLHRRDEALDAALQRADAALFQAKRQGRNRVEYKI